LISKATENQITSTCLIKVGHFFSNTGVSYNSRPTSTTYIGLLACSRWEIGNVVLSLHRIPVMPLQCSFPFNKTTVVVPIPMVFKRDTWGPWEFPI